MTNPQRNWRWVALLCVLLGAWIIASAEDIKSIHATGYVMDLAGILKPDTKTKLEALCTELEQKTGAQMAIVTVKSLDGNSIQQYANDLYKQLGLGQKKQDNGVLLLVAPNDRKYRIEVGYGLEPIINDARAGDAGRLLVPYFRQGDYGSGVTAAAGQLAKYIADDKGVTLTGMPQLRPVRRHDDHSGVGLWIILGIILLVVLFSGRGGSSSGMTGGGGFISGWLLGSLLSGAGSGSRGGGWGGGSGGEGWGGGGGGFGGFGGGSSGGGGADGSW